MMRAGVDVYPSVRALASRAGVAVSALYRLFPNMDALAIEVMRQADSKLYALIDERLEATAPTTLRADLQIFAEELERWRGPNAWMPRMFSSKLLTPERARRYCNLSVEFLRPTIDTIMARHNRRALHDEELIHLIWLVGAVQFMWSQGEPHAAHFNAAMDIVVAFFVALPPPAATP